MSEVSNASKLVLLFSGFVIGGLVGLNISGESLVLAEHPLDFSEAAEHAHTQLDVFEMAPTVGVEVIEESMPGKFSLRIETQNFTFAPEAVNGDHVPGEGHAHVYVGDVKISRAYSQWYDLPPLKPGQHTIRVTLNTNDHQEYAAHGEIVEAVATVTVATSSGISME